MEEQEKVTKFTASYRRSENWQHCADCMFFNRDGSCDRVLGRIRREDICDFWEQRDEAS